MNANVLLDDIVEKREKLLKETYAFIKNLMWTLIGEDLYSCRIIKTGLIRQGIDLSREKAPENASPEMLLKSLADILKEPPQDLEEETKPQPKRKSTSETIKSRMTKTPQASGARARGLAKLNIGGILVGKLGHQKDSKTISESVPSPAEDEFLKSWNLSVVPDLSGRIQDFRENKFKGLELQDYSELRSNHIL